MVMVDLGHKTSVQWVWEILRIHTGEHACVNCFSQWLVMVASGIICRTISKVTTDSETRGSHMCWCKECIQKQVSKKTQLGHEQLAGASTLPGTSVCHGHRRTPVLSPSHRTDSEVNFLKFDFIFQLQSTYSEVLVPGV